MHKPRHYCVVLVKTIGASLLLSLRFLSGITRTTLQIKGKKRPLFPFTPVRCGNVHA